MGLAFARAGAGRNFSGTAYCASTPARPAAIVAAQITAMDARFFCGIPNVSEPPGAYKNTAAVSAQIVEFGLAEVVDTIEPIGCIVAGDGQRDAPWRKKKGAGE
jgi:tRNA-splicing ligase RtcB (3'-phosphate/5'-hydroxy nucleic acid ligase)